MFPISGEKNVPNHQPDQECPRRATFAELPRETHPRSPQSSPAESAEEHSERSWQRRRKALLGSPAAPSQRGQTWAEPAGFCFKEATESTDPKVSESSKLRSLKYIQNGSKMIKMEHMLYQLVLQALYLYARSLQELGVGWLREKSKFESKGHNGKMILEDLRSFFANKAPFPWSADKISSSKAISSASASAGVPGSLWQS